MKTVGAALTSEEMASGVQQVFAQVTRYPLEILDLHAALEEELGIDSVKLGEVFAVLRDKYDLPETIGIPPEKLQTIAGIAAALAEHLDQGGNGHGAPAPATVTAPPHTTKHGNGSLTPAAFEAGVREVFAAVTRYPRTSSTPAPPSRRTSGSTR